MNNGFNTIPDVLCQIHQMIHAFFMRRNWLVTFTEHVDIMFAIMILWNSDFLMSTNGWSFLQRDAVTSFLQFNSCIGPVVLSNGHRIRQPEKVGEKAIKSSLTNGEKQTFQWLKATDVNYPLWRSTNCPQQMDDS